MRQTKRVICIGDTHCGHKVGLTPPDWWLDDDTENPHRKAIAQFQRESWDWYISSLKPLRPFYAVLGLGDAVDGKGDRSGGTELLTTDRGEQADMAAQCYRKTGCNNIHLVYGTPYHAGVNEDWEDLVAEKLKAEKIGGHIFPTVNGVTFSVRHFIGGSNTPYGRATPIMKEKSWNDAWVREYEEHPYCQVFIRGHVHFAYIGREPACTGIVNPAMQGMGSKYGARKCSGVVHLGFTVIDVKPSGSYICTQTTAKLQSQAVKSYNL